MIDENEAYELILYNAVMLIITFHFLLLSFMLGLIIDAISGLRKKYTNYYCHNRYCVVEEKRILRDKDIPYFRDIPCNGDIYKIFWIAKCFGLGIPKKGFIGANILKWINEGKARIIKKENDISIYIDRFETDNFIEKELQRIILDIADNQYLEVKDLKNKLKTSELAVNWYNQVFFSERDRLIEEKYLKKKDKLIISSQVYQDITEIVGLLKFLRSETIISEKKDIDIFLWGEYIMIAQMFGFAYSLEKEYKELYRLIDF